MPNRYKTISSETLNGNPWSSFKKNIFETKLGRRGEQFFLEKKGGAIIVPILPDGRLLMVSQYRYLQDKVSLEFPGGSIVGDETPAECAVRELREETGYTSDDLVKIGMFEASNGSLKNPLHLFVGDSMVRVGDPENSDVEEVEIFYRRADEVDEIIKRGEIWDGRTLAAWAMAREYVYKITAAIV